MKICFKCYFLLFIGLLRDLVFWFKETKVPEEVWLLLKGQSYETDNIVKLEKNFFLLFAVALIVFKLFN
jgi:hypothetical protein